MKVDAGEGDVIHGEGVAEVRAGGGGEPKRVLDELLLSCALALHAVRL